MEITSMLHRIKLSNTSQFHRSWTARISLQTHQRLNQETRQMLIPMLVMKRYSAVQAKKEA